MKNKEIEFKFLELKGKDNALQSQIDNLEFKINKLQKEIDYNESNNHVLEIKSDNDSDKFLLKFFNYNGEIDNIEQHQIIGIDNFANILGIFNKEKGMFLTNKKTFQNDLCFIDGNGKQFREEMLGQYYICGRRIVIVDEVRERMI